MIRTLRESQSVKAVLSAQLDDDDDDDTRLDVMCHLQKVMSTCTKERYVLTGCLSIGNLFLLMK